MCIYCPERCRNYSGLCDADHSMEKWYWVVQKFSGTDPVCHKLGL